MKFQMLLLAILCFGMSSASLFGANQTLDQCIKQCSGAAPECAQACQKKYVFGNLGENPLKGMAFYDACRSLGGTTAGCMR